MTRHSNEGHAMLKIEDLHARAGGADILKGIDLTVRPGEVHAIMGPNGSGKSTLSNALAGRASSSHSSTPTRSPASRTATS